MTTPAITTVPESDLGPTHERCPLCDSTNERRAEVRLQRDPDVWMSRCPDCHASAADRFPNAEFLEQLYDPSYYSSPLTSEDAIAARCAARILRLCDFDKNADLEILDYGGNRGSLAASIDEALVAKGHRGEIRSTIVDLFAGAPRPRLRFLKPDELVEDARSYDLILASAVLEHLTDLRDVLDRVLERASDGAIFWARTPFDVPLARLPIGYPVRWPRHLYDMGPQFWAHFLETTGVSGELLASRPSIVETSFASAPLRTVAATLLKAPAIFESSVLKRSVPAWPLVGGWEVAIRLSS